MPHSGGTNATTARQSGTKGDTNVVKCDKCGKGFRFASSIEKYHGWCVGKAPVAKPAKKASPLDDLFFQAEQAGERAATEVVPVPMIVQERANPFDVTSRVVKQYEPIVDGVCGFAWVNVPGNSAVAREAKKRYSHTASMLSVHKGHPKGVNIWVSAYNQSLTRKQAYARAYAQVLRDAGHEAYADSRMD